MYASLLILKHCKLKLEDIIYYLHFEVNSTISDTCIVEAPRVPINIKMKDDFLRQYYHPPTDAIHIIYSANYL